MKFMLVIPVELNVETTKRTEHRAAMKRKLVELARGGAGEFLRKAADEDNFLVRNFEPTPAKNRDAAPATQTAVTPAIES